MTCPPIFSTIEATWTALERELGFCSPDVIVINNPESGGRVYIDKEYACKVRLKLSDFSNARFRQSIEKEFRILKKLKGIPGAVIPLRLVQQESYDALFMKRAKGCSLDSVKFNVFNFISINTAIISFLVKLSLVGIIHGDMMTKHVFYDKQDGITVIDFGDASESDVIDCFFRNFLYRSSHPVSFNKPYLLIFVRSLEYVLPEKIQPAYRHLLGLRNHKKVQI